MDFSSANLGAVVTLVDFLQAPTLSDRTAMGFGFFGAPVVEGRPGRRMGCSFMMPER